MHNLDEWIVIILWIAVIGMVYDVAFSMESTETAWAWFDYNIAGPIRQLIQ